MKTHAKTKTIKTYGTRFESNSPNWKDAKRHTNRAIRRAGKKVRD